MKRIGANLLVVLGVSLAVLVGFAAWSAENDPETVRKGVIKIVVLDDDGNRREEVFEFDGDHPRPFLGVELGRADDRGARIEEVIEGSPAERAGLREGDVIVSFDGTEIDSPWDLTRQVLHATPGDALDLEVLREGRRETVTVEVGEREGWAGEMDFDFDFDFDFDSEGLEEQMERLHGHLEHLDPGMGPGHGGGKQLRWIFGSSRPVLGVELVEATPELREHLGGDPDSGVLVGKVLEQTPAEQAGVEVGDLIVAVGDQAIEGVSDLRRALRTRRGQTFDLEVVRDGRTVVLSVELPPADGDGAEQPGMKRFEHRRPGWGPGERT